mmetsp:Transcript_20716/g.57874  ORF Transcript_20716/g.57874 Transcript_20716/m.57874 type:complete len:208 (-) Transcript_20716:14-637(-)
MLRSPTMWMRSRSVHRLKKHASLEANVFVPHDAGLSDRPVEEAGFDASAFAALLEAASARPPAAADAFRAAPADGAAFGPAATFCAFAPTAPATALDFSASALASAAAAAVDSSASALVSATGGPAVSIAPAVSCCTPWAPPPLAASSVAWPCDTADGADAAWSLGPCLATRAQDSGARHGSHRAKAKHVAPPHFIATKASSRPSHR